MERPIICAIDGSQRSHAVAQLGARLASALGSYPLLVHVSNFWGSSMETPHSRRRAVVNAHDMLERICQDLSIEDTAKVSVEIPEVAHVVDPADRLIELARERSAELIVAGSRGRRGATRAVLGSVCSELGRSAPCPVCVLPEARARIGDWREQRPITFICGVDGSQESHAAVITAGALARKIVGRLILAHVHGEPGPAAIQHPVGPGYVPLPSHPVNYEALLEARRQRELRFLAAARDVTPAEVPTEIRMLGGRPAKELDRLAARQGAEMIFVGSRGRGHAAAAMFGSVSTALASGASRPVVILPPPAAAWLSRAQPAFASSPS